MMISLRKGSNPGALKKTMETRIAPCWHLYILRTADDQLYAGISTNVERRFREHRAQSRKTARYLLAHKPESLALAQAVGDRSLALKVEHRFKRLPKHIKERIISAGEVRFDKRSGEIYIS